MKDSKGKVIYIGKAKSLKGRVISYFSSLTGQMDKTVSMVEHVKDFDYILTDAEFEALVLECSLIKEYSPKYNILLKDDKGYRYIKITNERWPKICEAKQVLKDGAKYLGPYTSGSYVKQSVDEALKIFKLPTCNLKFTSSQGRSTKNRACLNYYINRCSGPCIGKIDRTKYLEDIKEAMEFLKGGNISTLKVFRKKMGEASAKMQYEKAAEYRDKIIAIEKISKDKQKVVRSKYQKQDVIAMASTQGMVCFEVFRFRNNKLYQREDFILEDVMDEKLARAEFLERFYYKEDDLPLAVMLDEDPLNLDVLQEFLNKKAEKNVKIVIPKVGESKQLVDMCKKNAFERISQKLNRTYKETYALEELRKMLNLQSVPNYIEAYDISNLMGDENVAGMVVFENAKPLKSAYKKFKIKSFVGQDDYASMKEVIKRRFDEYQEFKDTNQGFGRLPDLILLDGGKGQVNAVKEVLDSANVEVPVFGMVKNDRHKTRGITDGKNEVEFNSLKSTYKLIFTIQEEVHRFAIGYHRKKRNKKLTENQFTKLPKVGEKRAKILLKHYKSIENLKNVTAEELSKVLSINVNSCDEILNYAKNNL